MNFSIYTIEDLDHPELNKIYKIFWDITLIINVIFTILMLYTIIKKSSKEMDGYKWYLCHQLLWSFAFDFYMGIWKPIPLWPFFIGYSGGVFQNIPKKFSYYQFVIFANIIFGVGFSLAISFIHRYVQAAPLSKFYADYSRLKHRVKYYIGVVIFLYGPVNAALIYFATDSAAVGGALKNQNPIIEIFFERESSIFGHDRKDAYVTTATAVLITILGLLIIWLAMMYFNYLRILRKNKSNLTSSTYELQKLLFKTLYIQMILMLVILIIPTAIFLILALIGIQWVSKFSMICFMITSTHAIIDFGVLVYFIKPYRVFIFGLLKAVLAKIGINLKENTVKPMAVSTTVVSSTIH